MNQQKNYEINGLLKSGLFNSQQPIYIVIINLITNLNEVIQKLNSYLCTIKPFAPFILILCTQQTLALEISSITKLLNQFAKSIQQQQMQRISKLIIISDQLQQHTKVIPSQWNNILQGKTYYLQRLHQLNEHNIELPRHQQEFLNRLNNIYQEEQPFYGRELFEYPLALSGIPQFLETILQFYNRNDHYLRAQGVFRLSGSVLQEEQLIEQFILGNYDAVDKFEPDAVSTVLKNSLCKLKSPIFPYEVYDILKETDQNIKKEQLLEMFQVFFAYMPEINRRTTKRIAELLYRVASYEKENLMGLTNLSIVFAPCFLRSKNMELCDLMGAKVIVHHFNLLVQNVDFFSKEVHNERNSIPKKTD